MSVDRRSSMDRSVSDMSVDRRSSMDRSVSDLVLATMTHGGQTLSVCIRGHTSKHNTKEGGC